MSQLAIDTEKKCKKYLEYAEDDIQKMILYIFGKDDEKEIHILRKIHEKIKSVMSDHGSNETTLTSFSSDRFFTNLSYRQFCPVCSGMVDCYKKGLMKKFATNERCSASRNKCLLTFTSLFKGTWVRVSVSSDCPGCCSKSDSFNISSLPMIENINDYQQLLIDNPLDFVKN